jgi:hypothetical protein
MRRRRRRGSRGSRSDEDSSRRSTTKGGSRSSSSSNLLTFLDFLVCTKNVVRKVDGMRSVPDSISLGAMKKEVMYVSQIDDKVGTGDGESAV